MLALTLTAIAQISVLGMQSSSFDQAFQKSMETQQPLVVLIGAEWCPACVEMKNSILPEVHEAGGLDKVNFAYVDFDQEQELASKLSQAEAIPQLICFNQTESGWESRLLVGAQSSEKVQAFINAGLAQETNHKETKQTQTAGPTGNRPEDEYSRAYRNSVASGRPMVILLGAQWCPACVKMKNSILPQVAKSGGLQNVEFAYVDYDQQKQLAKKLSSSKSLPQLIRLTKTQAGWSRQVMIGAQSPGEVQTFIQNGMEVAAQQEPTQTSNQNASAVSTSAQWPDVFGALKRSVHRIQSGESRR